MTEGPSCARLRAGGGAILRIDLVKVTFINERMDSEVLIVGAGPAGIGCGLALRRAGVESLLVLEADSVGASFRRWPEQMRLITPSFHSNPFFQTDLNAITPDTSPGDFFQKEHLSGNEYADYLKTVVDHFALNLKLDERVFQVIPGSGGYSVKTAKETYRARVVVWAGGEFSNPNHRAFRGSNLCAHSSDFRIWNDYQGNDVLIIGGYESGIDAACQLVGLGKRVLVLSSGEPWNVDHPDPSEVLSPFTRERLLQAIKSVPGRLHLRGNSAVVSVDHLSGCYVVETANGEVFKSMHRPISATGFHSALTPIKDLFAWEGATPQFTEEDESTIHPGLFYSGPSLIQQGTKFCFIYKFRARFGVIARSVARRLGYPEPDLEDDRRRGFLVDELECCTNCKCAVESNPELLEAKA